MICIIFFLQVIDTHTKLPTAMPNQHDPDKEVIGVYLPREMAARVRRYAKQTNQTVTQVIAHSLANATKNTHLTAEDRREIAQRKNQHLARRASRKKSRTKGSQDRPD